MYVWFLCRYLSNIPAGCLNLLVEAMEEAINEEQAVPY
jgi:hypothetical protein